MRFIALLWNYICIFLMLTGISQAKGSNSAIRFRAERYGNYYSTVYYSYSGGKGYARYSRVYSHTKNHYPVLYKYMFDWLNTDQFKVYKNSPSGFISVCKNYEANENGTYLGIFTCPLPFVPDDHSYCCGQTNAQYCCKFWDIPLNFAAAVLAILMGMVVFLTSIYVIIQLCKNKRKANEEMRKRKAIRRIGLLRRNGCRLPSDSLWAHALFNYLHAESNYSETCKVDDEEEKEQDIRNGDIKIHGTNKRKGSFDSNSDKEFVKGMDGIDGSERKCVNRPGKVVPLTSKESVFSIESGFIEDSHVNDLNLKNGKSNKTFLPPLTADKHADDNEAADYPDLKPLRSSPRTNFNCEIDANILLTSKSVNNL